jgi:hypothetical protein
MLSIIHGSWTSKDRLKVLGSTVLLKELTSPTVYFFWPLCNLSL